MKNFLKYFLLLLVLFLTVILSCKKDEIEKNEGTLAWKTQVGTWLDYGRGYIVRPHASPAIGKDGTIYTEGLDPNDTTLKKYYLYALKPDGTIKWKVWTGDYYGVSSITLAPDGTIYAGCFDGLIAINPDGTLKWKRGEIMVDYDYFPALGSDNILYIPNSCYELCAVKPDGTLKWRISLELGDPLWGDSIYVWLASSLVIGSDGTIYFVAEGYVGEIYDAFLFALNSDGTIKWVYPTETEEELGFYPIAIGPDGIYFGCDEFLWLVKPNGRLKWRRSVENGVSSIVLGQDGTIYLSDRWKYIYAFSSDRKLKWKTELEDELEPTFNSLTLGSDGTVYVTGWQWDPAGGYPYVYYGYLYAYSSRGELKWKFKPGGGIWVPPTLEDGTIYFNATDGYFYAVHGSKPLAKSPWPKYQCDLQNTGRAKGGKK